MSFDQLGLRAELLSAVRQEGYATPTPIQQKAIPVILSGRDVLGGAQTGTGKTAAFALPILQLLHSRKRRCRAPRVLVLAPTRELAAQVCQSFSTYGKHLHMRATAVFGGVNINPQKELLRRGVDILVACPGRLLDHAGQGTVDLSAVEILVLDEADRMLDMGFIHDIRRVLRLLPKQRQNLLFSATYSNEIKQLADKLLNGPEVIEVSPRNTAAKKVSHLVYPVAQKQKSALLSWLIREHDWKRVLVFTRTKHRANRLTGKLLKDGISAVAIHGNKSQSARTAALNNFKCGQVHILVATDIAARGLDIDQLPLVVNFELPHVSGDYIHRIGRTGRAGADGNAFSLVCQDELSLLRGIERLLKRTLPRELIPGFEPAAEQYPHATGSIAKSQPQSRPRPPRGPNRRRRGSPRSQARA